MRRLFVFTASMVAILMLSAVVAGAESRTIVTPTSPAHPVEGLTVTVDPDLGDVSVTDAIFINNPGSDGIATVKQLSSGADIIVEIKVRYIDGERYVSVLAIPPDGSDACIPSDPGCE